MTKAILLRSSTLTLLGEADCAAVRLPLQGVAVFAHDPQQKRGFAYLWSQAAAVDLPQFLKLLAGQGVANASLEFKVVLCQSASAALRSLVSKLPRSQLIENCPPDQVSFYYAASGKLRVPQGAKRLRVVVVDDSKTIRDLLGKILGADESIEVVAAFANPLEALNEIPRLKPDVITLDIHMPEMNGIQLLEKIFAKTFIPTVMITSLSMEDGPEVLRALELGAVEYIQKPSFSDLEQASLLIREKIKAAATAKDRRRRLSASAGPQIQFPPATLSTHLIAIGSSTGGTEALRAVFEKFPAQIPPVIVVQHIPPVFSLAFAKRLNEILPFEVREAQDGDVLRPGLVLIAPGGRHVEVRSLAGELRVHVNDGAPVNRHKPSVDVMFESLTRVRDRRIVGVILTGMGADGARGLKLLRDQGARTIAQDEDSCVVYGMPREAVRAGAVEVVKPLDEIPGAIVDAMARRKVA